MDQPNSEMDPSSQHQPSAQPPSPHPRRRSKGKPVLTIALVVALMLALGGGAYAWLQITSLSSDKNDLSSQVDSLRRQLAEAKATPTPTQTPIPTPAAAPKVITIKEFGVKFTVPGGLSDLKYDVDHNVGPGVDAMDFTTQTLLAADPACSATDTLPLGSLERFPKGKFPQAGDQRPTFIKTIGAYDYGFSAGMSQCSSKQPVQELQSKLKALLADAIRSLK